MTDAGHHRVTLASTSRATDAGYRAAADLAEVSGQLDVAYRLIGGNAVTLLTSVYDVTARVPARDTADADFGAGRDVIGDPRLPQALIERGYALIAGNRFARTDPDSGDALTVDVLAPSYTAKLQTNRRYGELYVDEIPGLAFALGRPATAVVADVLLTTGATLHTRLLLPDVVAALCLKAYAYAGRLHQRDAVDVWRLLEAAHAAGVRAADDWPTSATGKDAARILHRHFGGPSSAGTSDAARASAPQARIRALVAQVVGARPADARWLSRGGG